MPHRAPDAFAEPLLTAAELDDQLFGGPATAAAVGEAPPLSDHPRSTTRRVNPQHPSLIGVDGSHHGSVPRWRCSRCPATFNDPRAAVAHTLLPASDDTGR